jgi:hypothetical protein
VLPRNDGRSDFVALMTKRADRMPRSGAFDHLRLGPLEARWGSFPATRWPPRSEVAFAKARELGLSKQQGSFYRSGKSRNWLKTINADFVRTRRKKMIGKPIHCAY